MKQQRNFLLIDLNRKTQDLWLEIDDSETIDNVKAKLKKQLGLTDEHVIEFPRVKYNSNVARFNEVYRGPTHAVIKSAKAVAEQRPVPAASDIKITPAIATPPLQEITRGIHPDVGSFKNDYDKNRPYQDAHFCLAIDFNRPDGLRDDFAEQAVNQALQQTFKQLSAEIDQSRASAKSGATLTVCAVARVNIDIDSKDIKTDVEQPVTVMTAQLGDSAAHLIAGARAKLLAPIHRTTNKTEKTRVDAAVTKLDNPAMSIAYLSAKQARGSEICLTTDGVWESVTPQHLVDCSSDQLCRHAAKKTKDDLTAVKVALAQLPAGKIMLIGISDGNGDNGHIVAQHIASNFAATFTKNLTTSLDAANKAQREFKLAGKVVEPKAVINNFIEELDKILRECDKRLGPDHNHQGLQIIKDHLAKIKANRNNPWVQLEKLGKEISQRYYGFWASIKKYARDPLVHAMYANLIKLSNKNYSIGSLMNDKLNLLSNVTHSLQNDLGRIKKQEFSENPFAFRR